MVKALIKNQFAQLFPGMFVSRKAGKKKSLGGTVLTFALYGIAMVSLTFFFFTVGLGFTPILHMPGMSWVYYALMGILTLIWGIFGSIFTTYVALYKGKDNEILLPLPIPYTVLVSVRLIMVFLTSLLYGSMGWIAAILAAAFDGQFNILSVLSIPFLGLFISFFTTFFGFIVAIIAGKIKNKSFMTIVIWILCFGLYYAFVLNLEPLLSSVITNAEAIADGLSKYAIILVLLSKGASGDILSFLVFAVISVVLFIACILLVSRTFMSVVGKSETTVKREYKGNNLVPLSVSGTLYKREMMHFLSNPTYMLNCGLGLLILAGGAVFIVIKGDMAINYLSEHIIVGPDLIHNFLIIIVTTMVIGINSLNDISAPSVSLEGQSLWILKSLPLDMKKVIMAKLNFHVRINALFSIIFLVAFNIAYPVAVLELVAMIITVMVHIVFVGEFGLFMNLLRPNLDWTNEAIPVKQSMSIFVTLIGTGFVAMIFAFSYIIPTLMLRMNINPVIFMGIFIIAEGALDLLLFFWLGTAGKKIMDKL